MLAIVTPNPDSTAETFIRQHINLLAPGQTVVVYFSGEGRSLSRLKSLKIPSTNRGGLQDKLIGMQNLFTERYSGCLRKQQEEQFKEFLLKNEVQCVLAEFGQTG